MSDSSKRLFLGGFLVLLAIGFIELETGSLVRAQGPLKGDLRPTIKKTSKEWRKVLSPKQFYVLREKGTEQAFSGKYWNAKEKGMYHCSACGAPLFESEHKFKSGTGWPSFYQAANSKAVTVKKDLTLGTPREEILCARRGGHLGHVFNDGPRPTGLRYCVNSVSLNLIEEQKPTPLDAGIKKSR